VITGLSNLHDAKVNWHSEIGKMPILELIIDHLPLVSEFIYEQHGDLYYAQRPDGITSCITKRNPFDGLYFRDVRKLHMRHWKYPSVLVLEDSRTVSAGQTNSAGLGPCVDVVLTHRLGNYSQSGQVVMGLARKAIVLAGARLKCYTDKKSGYICWYPWREEDNWKFENLYRLD